MINKLLFPTVALLLLAGCGGPSAGFIIKPVPVDETLTESVIQTDAGLFIRDKIAIIDVDGVILNQRERSLLSSGDNPVSLFVEKVQKAQCDADVKAVIVRINSPGGGVTASDIMYRRLLEMKTARQIPVIAVIEDVGASGGYYIACGADAIIAHPTSITGSIGVIVQTVSFAGTMKMIGIDARAVTSGAMKDMISPLKPLDEKDLVVVKAMVDEYYGRFLAVVAAGRPKMQKDKLKALADGRVYTGEQAKANGLVDATGYMNDAIAMARQTCNITKAKVVIYDRPCGYKSNAYSVAPGSVPQMNLVNINMPELMMLSHPQFMYLWTGN